jgi:hypothetical protein
VDRGPRQHPDLLVEVPWITLSAVTAIGVTAKMTIGMRQNSVFCDELGPLRLIVDLSDAREACISGIETANGRVIGRVPLRAGSAALHVF